MSASAEASLNSALNSALATREVLELAVSNERNATVRFMDEALHHGWSWEGIGRALNVTGTGARRYYNRNKRQIRGA